MRWLVRLLFLTLALAAGPMLLAAVMFRSFLYYPTFLDSEQVERLARMERWKVASVQATSEIRLVGLVRPPSDPGRPWALFFGGNAMDLGSSQWALNLIDDGNGFGLAVFAYRGYDGSTGTPTEAGLLHDAEIVADWLENEHGVEPRNLVLVGQSLGSGIAAHLAAALARKERPARGLALLSPYTSIARVFDDHVPMVRVGWAIQDRYDTEALLHDIPAPVVIVHGTDDLIIDVDHAKDLAEALGPRAKLLLLEGIGHNDLWGNPKTAASVRSLLK